MRQLIAAAVALALSGPALARDLALVVANEDYESLPEVREGDDTAVLVDRLRAAGFEVVLERDADLAAIRDAVGRFVERAPDADRLLVVLNGHFLRTDRDWFLLPVDRGEPGLAALARRALPVSILSTVLDDAERGRAVMVLGTSRRRGEASPYVERGLVSLRGDPGHVLIGGAADVAGAFAREVLAVPGAGFDVRDVRGRRLAVEGLPGSSMTFIPGDRRLSEIDGATQAEQDYWDAIRSFDTERAYANYLDRFPDGSFAGEAAAQLEAIRADPVRRARQAEAALGLDREDRRRVQASLSVLGFDPRGIDGIFGGGTRTALEAWQRSEGLRETGYLTADQLSRLSAQAGRRTAEFEAQRAREAAEARRLDTAYWAQVGEGGGEAGLRAYLERYPDGLFADRARDRLAGLGRATRDGAALADARAWDAAREADRPRAYRRYIEAHPEGAHVEEARARIDEIRGARRDDEAAAAEAALGLSTVTRSLAEGRLEAFGFEPGAVDGRFDEETRRAIRRYQRSRGLEPTGYLDQGVVAQLLADSFLR